MRFTILICCFLSIISCTTPAPPTQQSTTDTKTENATPAGGGSEKLYAHKWILTELNGKVLASTANDTAYLLFYPGQVNRVTGSTGCNNLSGRFELNAENEIKFSPLATTRRMCVNGGTQEQSFLTALQQTTNFYVTDDELSFMNKQATVLKFKAADSLVPKNDNASISDAQYRHWNNLLGSGVDFTATGNEPFWLLEISLKNWMRFKLIDGDSVQTSFALPQKLKDAAATRYTATTEKGTLQVTIYDTICINSMSGDTIPKKVEVVWKEKKYEGCGRFLADYRLNDVWVLKSINDSVIEGKKLIKGAPRLEINLTEKRVSGHSGCNSFGGSVEPKGRFISFNNLVSTRMACADNGFEKNYYRLLAEKDMPYKVENGWLTIHSGSSKLRYKKID